MANSINMTPRKRSRLTRSQRKRLYLFLYAIMFGIVVAVFWVSGRETWTATKGPTTAAIAAGANAGTWHREWGLLTYLEITQTNVNTNLQPVPGAVSQTSLSWHGMNLVLLSLGTAFAGVICFAALPMMSRRDRLPASHCDECAYELQGLSMETERCPECGAKLDHAARSWLRKQQHQTQQNQSQ